METNHIETTYYRTFAAINLDAIHHNLCALKTCLKGGAKAMAVVKADAYGHGSTTVAKYIEPDVDYMAVACIEEAIELRQAGITKPILILSYTTPLLYGELIEYDITATIYNYDEAQQLSQIALQKNTKAKVHLALDTGMGRIGFAPDEEKN